MNNKERVRVADIGIFLNFKREGAEVNDLNLDAQIEFFDNFTISEEQNDKIGEHLKAIMDIVWSERQ